MYLARVTDAANVSMSEKTSSSNSEVSNNGEYEYRIKDDGTGEIIQYLGNEKVLNIPSIIDGVKITSIAGGILGYNKITEVTISEGITSINDNAFQWCDELKKVTIPISVTNIGRSAFGYCSELSEVNIPGGINVNIGVGVFTGYNQIE